MEYDFIEKSPFIPPCQGGNFLVEPEKTLHPFCHALLTESELDGDMLLEITLLLGFFDSEPPQVFPELDDRIKYYGAGKSRVGEKKRSLLVVEEFFSVEKRKSEIERAPREFREILSGHHPAESAVWVGHLDAELPGNRVPESIRSHLRETLSPRGYDEIFPFGDFPGCLMDPENTVLRFLYPDNIASRSDFGAVFPGFFEKEIEEILGFPTFEYDPSPVLDTGANPSLLDPLDHVIVRELRQ